MPCTRVLSQHVQRTWRSCGAAAVLPDDESLLLLPLLLLELLLLLLPVMVITGVLLSLISCCARAMTSSCSITYRRCQEDDTDDDSWRWQCRVRTTGWGELLEGAYLELLDPLWILCDDLADLTDHVYDCLAQASAESDGKCTADEEGLQHLIVGICVHNAPPWSGASW